VCGQVEVSAIGWSLVQRSPTECGAPLCVIVKNRWGSPGPNEGCRAMKLHLHPCGPQHFPSRAPFLRQTYHHYSCLSGSRYLITHGNFIFYNPSARPFGSISSSLLGCYLAMNGILTDVTGRVSPIGKAKKVGPFPRRWSPETSLSTNLRCVTPQKSEYLK
jgi:hypothetical protein